MLEREEGDEGSEDDSTLRHTTSQSEEFHLCRETASSECSDTEQRRAGPQPTNHSSSPGVCVRSDADNTDAPGPSVESCGFLRLPSSLLRCGPGGRTHIRGLSMDSGKDAVLLSDHTHTVRWQLCSSRLDDHRQSLHRFVSVFRPP